jgi:alkylation response protein AidB-like acyl-CoA dehydrogenase
MQEMSQSPTGPTTEERTMLRDALRRMLEQSWKPAQALALAASPEARHAAWDLVVQQGLAELGSDPEQGMAQEAVVALEELGRAASPVPLASAFLTNVALRARQSENAPAAALLRALHAGQARVGFCFAQAGGDVGYGALTLLDGTVTGALGFVENAADLTHLVAVATCGGHADEGAPGEEGRSALALVIVDAKAAGTTISETPLLGAPGWQSIELRQAPAEVVSVSAACIGDLVLLSRICNQARAHGAARRAFEEAVAYAKERSQFGKPIGSFQAIQHKLANCLIALEGVRLSVEHAARQYDEGTAQWRYFANTAFAFAADALRSVSLETHHAFGAIGYAEEHEAPRHFRRVHLDMLAHGGAQQARDAVADFLLCSPGAELPSYDLGVQGNAFRAAVREWFASNWSGARKAAFDEQPYEKREFEPQFALDLGKTGWIGVGWPEAFGGQARSPMELLAFMEEVEQAEAPRSGNGVHANALMLFGTPAQQERYLPEILQGQAIHGMGYSEPQAGSDLAAVKTTAVKDGDGWRIDGQKIWTTTWWGKYMLLLTRTDAHAKPAHAGISMFIVPMDTPGITVHPARTMYGGTFANVFYDNVRVPADALLGELHGGWKILTTALGTERALVGGGISLKVAHQFNALLAWFAQESASGRNVAQDRLVRDKLARLAAEIEVGRQFMVHCARGVESGDASPSDAAIGKVYCGELMERFGEAALDIIGLRATLSEDAPGAVWKGKFEQKLRNSLMWVISVGTNEIQRSLIAQRGLGLPRK